MNRQSSHQHGTTLSTQAEVKIDRGGHELINGHEILSSYINVLDQYLLFKGSIKEKGLVQILERQYAFVTVQYNRVVEAYATAQKPSQEMKPYMMKVSNEITYGMKSTQPKKPNQSAAEVNDAGISGYMLAMMKSAASKTTTTALEVANPVVRRVLVDSVPNFAEMAYELFLYQNQQGYYPVPQLNEQDWTQLLQGYAPSETNIQLH